MKWNISLGKKWSPKLDSSPCISSLSESWPHDYSWPRYFSDALRFRTVSPALLVVLRVKIGLIYLVHHHQK